MLPVTVRLKDQQVVIVGGGNVAARRIQYFLDQEATIIVVSPSLNEELQQRYLDNEFTWRNRPFHESDVDGALIIIAATNSQEVNAHVGLCCKSNQLVNIADDTKKSNFYFPATLKKGLLTIAVTTSGASPVLSQKIRDDIASNIDDRLIQYIDFVKSARRQIIDSPIQPLQKKLLLSELIETPMYSESEQQAFLQQLALNV
jgi:precorrin-2 dehydrogenase / sirohydrochlorin ferrochelatase